MGHTQSPLEPDSEAGMIEKPFIRQKTTGQRATATHSENMKPGCESVIIETTEPKLSPSSKIGSTLHTGRRNILISGQNSYFLLSLYFFSR